jgi:hypothetical protein
MPANTLTNSLIREGFIGISPIVDQLLRDEDV